VRNATALDAFSCSNGQGRLAVILILKVGCLDVGSKNGRSASSEPWLILCRVINKILHAKGNKSQYKKF
jgi:hypothetical protein